MKFDVITHYYLPDKPPFLSLSDLDGDADNIVFQQMLNRHKVDPHYQRRYGVDYLNTRKQVETKLKKLFVKRGGIPTRRHPIYFVLGVSNWFKSINTQHLDIQIPISDLPRDKVSITFPDSYIAMTAKDKPYFEKVYFLDEIEEMIANYGVPTDSVPQSYDRYWEGNFEHYFEVQVWDDDILNQYSEVIDIKVG